MKNAAKKGPFVGLIALLALPYIIFTTTGPLAVNAASPMPTNINVTDTKDEQISAYYEGINGKSGDDLLAFLYTKIKDHNEYNFTSETHRYIFKIIDRNWNIDPLTPAQLANFDYAGDNGYIHKLYADYNDDIATADRFHNEGADRVSFDKEHIWAQTLGDFGRHYGAGSDFHALWPSDVKGNQTAHNNYNFGTPTKNITSVKNDKGTLVGRNGYREGEEHKVFEPLDEYKGDIARAMFYMPARYYEYIDSEHPKLALVNGSPDAVKASESITGKAGDLATLLLWHEQDPVSDYEIHRNNLIYNNYQGNRNPFIDYPAWARIAYDPTYNQAKASNALGTSSATLRNPAPTPDPSPEEKDFLDLILDNLHIVIPVAIIVVVLLIVVYLLMSKKAKKQVKKAVKKTVKKEVKKQTKPKKK